MRRITLALLSLFMAFTANTASAGRILVIEGTGNYYDSEASWHPYHPGVAPEEYVKGNFVERIMLDLDSCSLSKNGGTCNRMRTMIESYKTGDSWGTYNFDSGWFTPVFNSVDGPYQFNIYPDGFDATLHAVYGTVLLPTGEPAPGGWGTGVQVDLHGNWSVPFNDFSELYGKKIRMIQPGEEGFDGRYFLNASFQVDDESGIRFIAETWFEHARIYVIPEPSSIALMGLALAGMMLASRRKS